MIRDLFDKRFCVIGHGGKRRAVDVTLHKAETPILHAATASGRGRNMEEPRRSSSRSKGRLSWR